MPYRNPVKRILVGRGNRVHAEGNRISWWYRTCQDSSPSSSLQSLRQKPKRRISVCWEIDLEQETLQHEHLPLLCSCGGHQSKVVLFLGGHLGYKGPKLTVISGNKSWQSGPWWRFKFWHYMWKCGCYSQSCRRLPGHQWHPRRSLVPLQSLPHYLSMSWCLALFSHLARQSNHWCTRDGYAKGQVTEFAVQLKNGLAHQA